MYDSIEGKNRLKSILSKLDELDKNKRIGHLKSSK